MRNQTNLTLSAAIAGIALVATSASGAVSPREYGAKGDGVADDSAAIQQALDHAGANRGGIVELEAAKYRIDKPLNVPQGVTLAGVWQAPHHAQLANGTVLLIHAGKNDEKGPGAVTINASSAVKGITFFYPEQRVPGTLAYSYTVQGKGMHGSVLDCTFVNSYQAIDFGTYANELHLIRNCFGCPLKVGVHIDKCTDIGRIENVHFNPHYWARAGSEGVPDGGVLIKYLGENLVAFEFARTDWEYVLNTFVFGAKVGYRFYRGPNGAANGNFLGLGADWCGRAIHVEQCQPPGLLITNGEFVGNDKTDIFMEIAATHDGVVQLGNCSFWGPASQIARIAGKGSVSFSQCTFLNQGHDLAAYTIDALSGDLNISNCRFGIAKPDIRLGQGVTTAVISGNRFYKAKRITNESTGDVQEGLNVVRK
ncbi:MAG: glycosyl hydrolase family 28-related protein [Verrucomicrobia bacterium]|nr:glycosyl hydrolase family 28-related protein [Verrucomicrobiota bacterium]